MALPDTSVKVFTSADAGAGVMSGTAGALVSIFDACLLNGYNLKSVTSLTASAGVATATANGHGFKVGQVAFLSGASDGLHNGEKKITSVTANTISYPVDPSAAASPTGTISVKMAPLAWNNPFTGTNLRVYTSASPQSLGMLLRVDDTGTNNARVVGYESMTDVSTGTGKFALDAQVSGGKYWPKSDTASGAARNWLIAGDSKRLYYWCAPGGAYTFNGILSHFGDPNLSSSIDAFGTYLSGPAASQVSQGAAVPECLGYGASSVLDSYGHCPRAYFQTGSSIATWKQAGIALNGYSGAGASLNWVNPAIPFPNPVDNGLILSPAYFGNSGNLRGTLAGLYLSPQNLSAAFNHLDTPPGQDALVGKTLLAVQVGTPGANTNGFVFFDTTGPW